ncbi:MAG TPA: DNA-directed DNA polymerase [archaeon]|nr:DNA-directed DNA polymerase [archaeon]
METILQVLDCDYINVGGKTVVRIFGKNENGESVTVFYDKYKPYFYIQTSDQESAVKEIKNNFSSFYENHEMVERFLPIGYNDEKTKLMKIILNDPSKVPDVRDHLKRFPFVKQIFEADILFKYRFMADFGIYGMRWIKVTGEPESSTKLVKTAKKINAQKIEPLDKIKTPEFKYLSFDIEVAGKEGMPDPRKDPVIMISLAFNPKINSKETLVLVAKYSGLANSNTLEFPDEKAMMMKFMEIIDTYDPDVITGYNINSFDLPYINERMRILGLVKTIGRCNQKQLNTRKLRENLFLNSIPGRIIVDPYTIIKEMSKRGFFVGLKRYSLEDVSQHILGEGKIDIVKNDIPKYWNGKPEDVKLLIEYARKDSVLALRIVLEKQLLDKYIGVSLVSGVLLQDAMDSGEAVKVDNILLREFNKQGFVIPNKPSDIEIMNREREREEKELKGAFVLDPIAGLHTNYVAYLDFASMYPSIFMAFNICPTTILTKTSKKSNETLKTPYGTEFVSTKIRQGIIPTIVKNLIDERGKVKNEMKKERIEEKLRALDANQEALKRMTNAFYGYTGFMMARLYVLDIANAITSCGRYYIQKMKEIVESKTEYKVIYGDTDSAMIETTTKDMDKAFEVGDEIAKILNKEFEGVLKIKVENVFKSLIILSKKRYVGWSFEKSGDELKEKMIMKGIETVRRDWCNLVSEVLNTILNILLKEQNPEKALNYMKEIVKNLQENKIDLEKLVITKGISKRPEEYKGAQPHVELMKKMRKRDIGTAPFVGDRIGFVIVKGLKNISDRAEDLTYVKEHGLKIDSKYYIENQLLPPLERVFEAMGVDKGELFRVGKQMLISDIFNMNNDKSHNGNSQATILKSLDGFICNKCNKTYGYLPLVGKCSECSGEIMFFSGEMKSKTLDLKGYLNLKS